MRGLALSKRQKWLRDVKDSVRCDGKAIRDKEDCEEWLCGHPTAKYIIAKYIM